MESWIPLLQVFLNSTCPESEASNWLEEMFYPPASNSPPISTTSFLSLLMRTSDISSVQHSSPQEKRVMWIETLPSVVQARILSFLAYEHQRFCRRELCRLARLLLSEGKQVDFWVKKAAQQLLDLVSLSNYQWLSHMNLDSEEETEEDDFYMMPDWLRDAARDGESVFPWLPLSVDELSDKMPLTSSRGDADDLLIDVEESKQKYNDEVMVEIGEDESNIDTEVEKVAKSLKTDLLHIDSSLKAAEWAREICKLCSGDDETAAVLLSHLSDGIEADECDWPAHILCSVFLPKFLALNEPSSRVLLNATLDYCRAHQRATEYALLFPLILRKDGINSPVCDVLTRLVRECLHPAHVSAFCQKLLSKDEDVLRFVCLPCHRCLIGEELVWTESLFSLWKNILDHNVNLMQDSVDHNVNLMQDSVDQLVKQVCKYSKRYSKSLKFANFVLCLVNKCNPSLRPHKLILTAAVEKSDTLLTKSILSKLSAL
ncbi:hypothetical protein AAHA92_15473 [Salvia divinorum]|uniref:Fanconi Anaemia group E protein C-terminal domain-containing protein n=1 Tax=Salvia divinorum TaxID=28513 RepID=A0ABD1HF02_SALDI